MNKSEIKELLSGDLDFRYQFLGRLQFDCEYFLGFGSRSERVLWAKNVDDHISLMRDVYNTFRQEEKPQWMSLDIINNYEKCMKG